jgi:hypothetical protein
MLSMYPFSLGKYEQHQVAVANQNPEPETSGAMPTGFKVIDVFSMMPLDKH